MKSLAEQIADLEDPAPPPEFDPESNDVFAGAPNSDSDADNDAGEFDGREHYETVGKSKLRKPAQPTLGKQYAGQSVSRSALNDDDADSAEDDDEDDSDPFAKKAGSDEDEDLEEDEDSELDLEAAANPGSEIDSDEAFGSGDEEHFKGYTFRGSRLTRADDDDSNDESEDLEEDMEDLEVGDEDDEDEDEDEDEGSDIDMDDDEDEDDEEEDDEDGDDTDATSDVSDSAPQKPTSSDRAALRALMTSDTKAVASTISAAAAADAQKGHAVKEQYQTFDKLIDLRIKLQKGVTAVNSMPAEKVESEASLDAVKKAEEAALQLWSTLESLRHDFLDAQESASATPNPKKRKRSSPATSETPLSELWSRTQALESEALIQRRAVLGKWSNKVQASTNGPEPRSRLLNGSSQSSTNITSVLDAYLATSAPKLVTDSTSGSTTLYDDAHFYQSLLRDLINTRSSTSAGNNGNQSTISATLLPSLSRLPKQHRPNVDTKASKGRKIRYTVHEKLLNFAAPEELSGSRWGDQQKDEFFGSLFGGRTALEEGNDDEDDQEDGYTNGVNGVGSSGGDETEGLRLFK